MKRTTAITVNGERWAVPRGFGRTYGAEARRQTELFRQGKPGKIVSGIIGAMRLIGYEPTVAAVIDWPLRKRVEAVVYAATVYARAGDNPVQRHPKPDWLDVAPWQGPWAGEGAFRGPTPTEITA